MIVSTIITNGDTSIIETKDANTTEMVVSAWANYPKVLKLAGDRLVRVQTGRNLHVISGKDYGLSLRKGEVFIAGHN